MARGSKLSVSIAPEACISAALMLVLIPLPWVAAWFLAAAIHELFHCLAVFASGKHIDRIEIAADGAKIETGALTDLETLICSLAGPVGCLTLLLTASLFPKLAVCAFLQSFYNLLPIYPLDGGRALLSFGRILFSGHTARKLCIAVKVAVLSGLLLLGVLSAFIWNFGILPLTLAALLFLRVRKIKIPCK